MECLTEIPQKQYNVSLKDQYGKRWLQILSVYSRVVSQTEITTLLLPKNSDNGKSIVQMRKDDSCLREGVGIVQVKEGKGHDRKMHRDS